MIHHTVDRRFERERLANSEKRSEERENAFHRLKKQQGPPAGLRNEPLRRVLVLLSHHPLSPKLRAPVLLPPLPFLCISASSRPPSLARFEERSAPERIHRSLPDQ